jgi:hypothetical protein
MEKGFRQMLFDSIISSGMAKLIVKTYTNLIGCFGTCSAILRFGM